MMLMMKMMIFMIIIKLIFILLRLDINLKSGKHEESATPFHLSVRFHEDIIVRNTKNEEGEWGEEEREENLNELTVPNPILPGKFLYILYTIKIEIDIEHVLNNKIINFFFIIYRYNKR